MSSPSSETSQSNSINPFGLTLDELKQKSFTEMSKYLDVVHEMLKEELVKTWKEGYTYAVVIDGVVAGKYRGKNLSDDFIQKITDGHQNRPYYMFSSPDLIEDIDSDNGNKSKPWLFAVDDKTIPQNPMTIEGYADFMVNQGHRKGWSNDTVWLMLSMFKEVGELVSEYEKIKSTEHATPKIARDVISEILAPDNTFESEIDGAYFITCVFNRKYTITDGQIKKIEKDTGYELLNVGWSENQYTQADNFAVMFTKPKNPYLKLGGESSDIDYFKWQFLKKVAPSIDLDKAMLAKMLDNEVKKKKTIDSSGRIVRK